MKFKIIIISLLFFSVFNRLKGQSPVISPQLLKAPWPSLWITHPNVPQREYSVFHFRKKVILHTLPSSFIIHISADNRYRLFINGVPVCSGPARGDLFDWYFETIDIAPYLKQGENTLAAAVWNMGVLAPIGQISNQTAFVLQGNTDKEKIVNTDSGWKVTQNTSYSPCSLDNERKLDSYMAVGPGDQVDGNKYPWGWEEQEYDDKLWTKAEEIVHPVPAGYGADNRWTLAPRTIPLFKEQQLIRLLYLRRSTGLKIDSSFIIGNSPIKISAHQKVNLLFDQGENIVAYPEIIVSGGKGSNIKQIYAESLFDQDGLKGNRNEIKDKYIKGTEDIFILDGGIQRKFRPLWFRAYRYLELVIETGDEELTINDLYSMKTGYPLQMNASFNSNDPSLQDIWKVGWRTAQLCAGEVYYDTPYYEQLQYTADTRIQALITLYVSGDDRLMRKAITDFYHSRTPEGLTQGRYPSNRLQIIPPFSLFWVSMVHDYWMHRKDDAFIRQFLPAINEVMEWFHHKVDPKKKMLGPLTWWNFVDWTNFTAKGKTAPGVEDGNSAIVTLQYAYTLKQAADLFDAFGHQAQAKQQRALAVKLGHQTYLRCFNKKRGLMANTPEQANYSQHAGIWALLSGAIPSAEVKPVMKKILNDKNLAQVTFYYRFYLTQAMKKANLGDRYYGELKPWREMLKLGLTTFAETPEPSRSDCHAWSASPDYDFLATICGIMPEEPGFRKILIKPALGELTAVNGSMPHPSGKISIQLKRINSSGIEAELSLPEKIPGTFCWKDKKYPLHGGLQKLRIE